MIVAAQSDFFYHPTPLEIGECSVGGRARKPRALDGDVCGKERILLQEVVNA